MDICILLEMLKSSFWIEILMFEDFKMSALSRNGNIQQGSITNSAWLLLLIPIISPNQSMVRGRFLHGMLFIYCGPPASHCSAKSRQQNVKILTDLEQETQ